MSFQNKWKARELSAQMVAVWILMAYWSAVPVQRDPELRGKRKRDKRRGEKLYVMPLYLIYVQQLIASFSIFQWLCCGSHNDLMNYEKWCCWYCYIKKRHTGQILSKLLHTQTTPKEYLKWNVKTHFIYLQTLNNVTTVFLTECRRES